MNSVKKNLAYKASTFIMMISVILSFGILFYFWSSIYRQGNQIGSYSFGEIITYYIFIAMFELIFTSNTAWGVGEEIKNGQITNIILKPIKYLEYKFSQSIGTLFYRVLFLSPVILLVLFVMRNFISKPQDQFGYEIFILLAIFSYILNFLIYYMVGILSFWMSDSFGFFYACMVLVSFMQGQWIPLDLLPNWLNYIGNYLPFKYLFFVPVGVASGRTDFDYTMVIVPMLWCIGLYVLAQFMYKKGLRKYEGYGA